MTKGAASAIDEDTMEELDIWIMEARSSEVEMSNLWRWKQYLRRRGRRRQVKVFGLRRRSNHLQRRVSSGLAKSKAEKRSPEEEPKELAIAFPNFLQDSVVPLLKYLNGKREKYPMSKEAGFYVEMLRNMTHIKKTMQ
ncbi:hypothetical protein AXG93_4266s1070 [Marchantia polymorpha subsp. ruderalis]|uniref:Uncharacterized protein n=1 Tax=Marchantia polymorpha subsp. ruderalis TaxID=1480154 RepID=A0A176VUH0_MARPO|nr:hypothetical protein AXG93_4266s1070 [Marchantia polymorpha subsp. ruderalis]